MTGLRSSLSSTTAGFGFALLVLTLVVTAAGFGASSARGATLQNIASLDSLEAEILVEINTLRRTRGLAPLRLSRALRKAADGHSAAMARGGFFQHESADGSPFSNRLRREYGPIGSRPWSVGENLLWASPDLNAKDALKIWLGSPSHRAILLTPRWREIGLSAVHVRSAPGVFAGREVTIVTADFGVRR